MRKQTRVRFGIGMAITLVVAGLAVIGGVPAQAHHAFGASSTPTAPSCCGARWSGWNG